MSETTIPTGFCQCGCGGMTIITKQSTTATGYIKGQPYRFLPGHNGRGPQSARWKGGKAIRAKGYAWLLLPKHPRADPGGYVLEHLVLVEKALGKPLPEGAEIHHFDKDKLNNKNNNLVVCNDHKYHHLLHSRQAAMEACGNPNYRRCRFCKVWDAPENIHISPHSNGAWHHVCINAERRAWRVTHREEINRRAREWRAKNPEKTRLSNQRQKAKREASLETP